MKGMNLLLLAVCSLPCVPSSCRITGLLWRPWLFDSSWRCSNGNNHDRSFGEEIGSFGWPCVIYGRAGPRPSSVALHGRYSASQLCHELRLSAGALRSRLAETVSEKPSSRPAFVPVHTEACNWSAPTVPLVSVAEIRLVWERADGTRLHLSLPASQWTQAEALCTAFLRS